MRRAVALALACTAAACSLFTDLGGFDREDPARDRSGPDAESDADAARDGGAATEPDAAASETGTAADGGPCGATFCDDFDTSPLGGGWTGRVESGGGLLRAEDAGVSLPNALRAESPASATDTSRKAYLYKRFPAPKKVSCSFAVYPLDLSAATEIMELYATTPGYAEYAIVITLRSDGTELALAARPTDAGSTYDPRAVPHVPVGRWTVITLAAEFTAAATLVTFSEDGIALKSETFAPAPSLALVDAQLGITYQYAMQSSAVRFDDVRCTAEN